MHDSFMPLGGFVPLVLIQFGGRKMGVPLAQLDPIGVDAEGCQALDDWRYWVGAGYTA